GDGCRDQEPAEQQQTKSTTHGAESYQRHALQPDRSAIIPRMKRFKTLAVAALIVAVALAVAQAQAPAHNGRRIAVFGSSVANGTGDELGREGYTGRLREMLAPKWEGLNQSRGGDNTR